MRNSQQSANKHLISNSLTSPFIQVQPSEITQHALVTRAITLGRAAAVCASLKIHVQVAPSILDENI